MVSFSSYNQFTKSWEKYSSEFIETITNELESYTPHLRERQKIIEKKSKEHFNIFSAISDVYKRENYNSDILRLILNPKTEDMGDSVYLKQFLLFIGLDEEDIRKYFGKFESVEVLREKHRIDILIRNKKYAVIIESKINETIDQPNQLVRYYKRVTEDDKLTVLKVVYLTLIPQKKPCFDYDSENKTDGITKESFENYVDAIKERLLCIPAVSDKSQDKGKTLKDFLESCKNQATTELGRVVISQYSKLLEKTGGDVLMLEPEKKLIQEIYSSKKRINDALSFVEVWEKKDTIIAEIYREKFSDRHKDWIYDESDETFYKSFADENLSLYYAPDYFYQLGFKSEKINQAKAKILKGLLNELSHEGLNIQYSDYEKPWVYIDFEHHEEPIDEFFEKMMDTLDELIKATKNLKL